MSEGDRTCPNESSTEKDEELDELLDSALQDFDKPKLETSAPPTLQRGESSDTSVEQLWNDEFLLEAQKKFEDSMKAIFDEGSECGPSLEKFEDDLQKIAGEAKKLHKLILAEPENNTNLSETIAETLQNLSENSQTLQSDLGADIATMLGGMTLENSEGSSDMMPFMQNMMELFLSKDVLYPGIMDIVEKYPKWLQEHKESLKEEEYNSFEKQLKIMKEVCGEFESETTSDSDDIKKERFTRILSLMEEMQNLGQPPKELVGDGSSFLFDENEMANLLPGSGKTCSLM